MACPEETFVASSSRGQQLVQHAAAATSKYDEFHRKELELELHRKALQHDVDNNQWREKMHRYPASIREIGERYTVPTIVSIGPYHHGLEHLKKAEEAKYVAAYSCTMQSKYSVQEMYDAVVSVAGKVRSLYDKDTMAGIHHEKDFCPMLFYDACFLMQFMLRKTREKSTIHPWLQSFFKTNKDDIYHDILLLENQLPRVVIEIFEVFTPVKMKDFARLFKAFLQNSRISNPLKDPQVKSSSIHHSILDGPAGFARPAYYTLLHFLVSVSGFHVQPTVQPTKLLWAVGKLNLF
jgi:hypothetical protein